MSDNIDQAISAAYTIEAAAKSIYAGAQNGHDTAKLDLNIGDVLTMAGIIVDAAKEQVKLLSEDIK